MTKLMLSLLTALLLAATSAAFAADISLNWDPSPSDSVVGYKVYYKAHNAEAPFDGTGANEGSSPVDVGDNLSITLTGLDNNTDYYFTVTAYDRAGNESSPANVVSSSYLVPEQLSPANAATNEPIPVAFRWTTAPNLSYTLYYGTTPDLAALPPVTDSRPTPFTLDFLDFNATMAALLLVLLLICIVTPKRRTRYGVATAALALSLLTACGGGGGGGDDSGGKQSSVTGPQSHEVVTVEVGASDYYEAYDLEPGTTYYWKVVGHDMDDPSRSYSSATSEFTTETF